MVLMHARKMLLKKNSKSEIYSRNPIYLWLVSCISYVHISEPLLVNLFKYFLSFLYNYYTYFTAKTIFSILLKDFNSTLQLLLLHSSLKFYYSYSTNYGKLFSSPRPQSTVLGSLHCSFYTTQLLT